MGSQTLAAKVKIDKSGIISFPFLPDIAVVGLTVQKI